jgi:hypothetical protein
MVTVATAIQRSAFLLVFFALSLAAADPFIGNWKFDPARSKLTGQIIRIAQLPDNNYEFRDDEHPDVILADGLDHPTHRGDTMAVKHHGCEKERRKLVDHHI